MASNILEEFFISIGVDSKDLSAGEKAVTSAVLSMQKSLGKLVGSFNETTTQAGNSQKKLGQSTEKLSKDLQASVGKVNNFFDSIKNNILALAGISLTMGGAMAWINNTTKGLIDLGVQSKALGLSAKEVDGWGRAFKTAGSSAEAAMQSLKSIQDAKVAYQMGRPSQFTQTVALLNSFTGKPQRIDWQNSDAGTLQRQIANMLRGVSKERAQFFGSQLGYDQATIMGMHSGQIQSDQRKFSANSGVTDAQIEKARQLKEATEALNQKMEALKLKIYERVLPALMDLMNWIDGHWPQISSFFMKCFTYVEGIAKAVNRLAEDMGGWKTVIIAIIGLKFATWLLGVLAVVRGAMGMGGAGLLGKGGGAAAGVIGAGVGGYALGSVIYDKFLSGTEYADRSGRRIAKVMAFLGSEDAKYALSVNEGGSNYKAIDAVKAGVKNAPVVAKKDNKDASEERSFWGDIKGLLKAIAGNTEGMNSGSSSGDGATASGSVAYAKNAKGVTRGERNNNPGNLNFANQAGASREGGRNSRFARFNTELDGIRAMYTQLKLHYSGKSYAATKAGHPFQTIKDIISAWAPENENNTKAYIANVSKKLGIGANQKLNFGDNKTVAELMKAIVSMENGRNRYSDELYYKAIMGNQYRPQAGSAQHVSNSRSVTHIQHVTVHSPATSVNQLTGDMQRQSRMTTANAFLVGSD